MWCTAQYGNISISYQKLSNYSGTKQSENEGLIERHLGFELFSMLGFSGTFSM